MTPNLKYFVLTMWSSIQNGSSPVQKIITYHNKRYEPCHCDVTSVLGGSLSKDVVYV